MKRVFLLTVLLCCAVFIYSHENASYILSDNCFSYLIDLDHHETKELKKNEKITCITSFIDAFEDNNTIIGPFFYNKANYYLVPVHALTPVDSVNVLPEHIITISNNGITKKVIPAYFLEILKTKDIQTLAKYETFFSKSADYRSAVGADNTLLSQMFTDDLFSSSYSFAWGYTVISNAGIKLSNSDTIYFKNIIKQSESMYDCEGIAVKAYEEWNPEENFWNTRVENTTQGKVETFTITIDGDYIRIDNKTRGTHITTVVSVDDATLTELSNVFSSNNCDLSKVSWPHHADGTCELIK
ncbi:MAG: hypothetical protein K6E51_05885 [Treponema sp.]|nr:hypothetical protein [Treponema sp.]